MREVWFVDEFHSLQHFPERGRNDILFIFHTEGHSHLSFIFLSSLFFFFFSVLSLRNVAE